MLQKQFYISKTIVIHKIYFSKTVFLISTKIVWLYFICLRYLPLKYCWKILNRFWENSFSNRCTNFMDTLYLLLRKHTQCKCTVQFEYEGIKINFFIKWLTSCPLLLQYYFWERVRNNTKSKWFYFRIFFNADFILYEFIYITKVLYIGKDKSLDYFLLHYCILLLCNLFRIILCNLFWIILSFEKLNIH